mmetsp:Transcript_891/g.3243  ORF Transcript_891/g.3243 Transcript_891/m.3243 type:complete len:494 (+) Transcript_891:226-1707(+)
MESHTDAPLLRSEKVAVATFDGTGRGVQCLTAVQGGEVLLRCPLRDCWTAANATQSPLVARLLHVEAQPSVGEFSEEDLISLHLMLEYLRGETSDRWNHIKELPESFHTPLLWSDGELYNLTGSAYQMLAVYLRNQVEDDYNTLMEKIGRRQRLEGGPSNTERAASLQAVAAEEVELERLTLDRYRWARACIQSRSMVLENDAIEEFLCLPGGGADMFNHSPEAGPGSHRLAGGSTEDAAVEVVATRDLDAGEQAFISYGARLSTASLLFSYGCVLPGLVEPIDAADQAFVPGIPSPNDFVEIVYTIPMPSMGKTRASASDSKVQKVREALMFQAVSHAPEEEQESFSVEIPDLVQNPAGEQLMEIRFRLTTTNPAPVTYLVLSRLETIDEATATAIEALTPLHKSELCLGKKAISEQNEMQTLGLLKKGILSRLRSYPTSISEDEALLKDHEIAERLKLAVALRLVEKRILDASLNELGSLTGRLAEAAFLM